MLLDKIVNAITETLLCDRTNISRESSLETLGIDSLKAINILYDLEEEFDIEVPNEAIARLVTVHDIELIIGKLIAEK